MLPQKVPFKLSHHHLKLIVAALLIFSTVIAYWPLKDNGFITAFDDNAFVMANGYVQGGLSGRGLIYAFTSSQTGNWHPLTWLSLMLDYQLYGLNPQGFHATNLIFHLANTLLLFLFLEAMTAALWPSALVAALFALHPLHVESVAWVAERKDVLSTFFWLTTMWAYLWYVRQPDWRRYWLILLSYTLGLMAKPMLVTLPLTLLLLDYWPLGRFQLPPVAASPAGKGAKPPYQPFTLRLIWEKIPFFILAALVCFLTIRTQRVAVVPLEQLSFSERAGNALLAYASYLEKMLWPVHLSSFYPYLEESFSWAHVATATVLLLFISFLALKAARKHPYFPVGWFWYLGTLVPVSGLVQAGGQSMADRYTYVPLMGIFIIIAWGLADLTEKWKGRKLWLGVAAGLWLAILMTLTWQQVGYWRDTRSLFEHAAQVTKDNYLAYSFLIKEYGDSGQIDEATKMYQKAVQIKNYWLPHYNYGQILLQQNRLDEIIPILKNAIQISPTYPMPYNSLGMVYENKGNLNEAVTWYQQAIKIDPTYETPYNNLGIVYGKQGNYRQAIAVLRQAIQLNPTSESYNNLGLALAKQGDRDQAVAAFQNALQINPHNAGAQEMIRILKSPNAPD